MQVLSTQIASGIGFAILPAYLLITILIGWFSRRRTSGSNDFLNATGSQPFLVVAAAFLAANCGALEIIGLSAVAAQYGVQAFHFYWIGAIPAMIFFSAIMIPIYMRCGVRSLPEYLELRFGPALRRINAWLLLVSVVVISGVGTYAIAEVLHAIFGWSFAGGAWLAASVVLIYVLLGGLRATIYNEVFQLLVIVAGLAPLLFRVHPVIPNTAPPFTSHWNLWKGLPVFSAHTPMDRVGVIVGLGCVLSTSYWCADFVQVQRALTARSIHAGRMVPLAAGFGKLFFSLLVVLPALGAEVFLGAHKPASYDQTLPILMTAAYGPLMLGLGLTAMLASLMSGMAASVSAFASLWTEEIYRVSLRRHASEQHYLHMGRAAIFTAVLLSIASSYLAFCFRDLMELVQMVFSLCGAPFFAVLLMGFFSRRATNTGAIAGLLCGVSAAGTCHLLAFTHRLTLGSQMSVNFYSAICAFVVALAVGLLASRSKDRKSPAQLDGIVFSTRDIYDLLPHSPSWWILACTLLLTCAALNYLWR